MKLQGCHIALQKGVHLDHIKCDFFPLSEVRNTFTIPILEAK